MSNAGAGARQPKPIERLLQLLADRTTQGLGTDQRDELLGLLEAFPDIDEEALDRTAAALELAFGLPQEMLPEALRETLLEQGQAFLHPSEAQPGPTAGPTAAVSTPAAEPAAPEPVAPASAPIAEAAGPGPIPATEPKAAEKPVESLDALATDKGFAAPPKKRLRPKKASQTSWLGWLAAAVFLALAVTGWWPRLYPPPQPSPTQQRAALLDTASDAWLLKWQSNEDETATDTGGDLVWSNDAQQGYMRFRSLAPNNPRLQQYQLWIIDGGRRARYPVSGGVFDVPPGGDDVIVSIRPALTIKRPDAFMVTLEPVGGTVVSENQRWLLKATVE